MADMKHVGVPNPPRVRVNRGDRNPPFLSNLVQGTQEQLTPNGCTYDGPWPENEVSGSIVGSTNAIIPPAKSWPKGNRSGE